MKKIVIYPADCLRVKTKKLETVNPELLEDIKILSKILEKGENAAGLAATQLNINKRFFGIKNSAKNEVNIFINPKIEETYGEKIFPKIIDKNDNEEDFLEGCLSFPDYYGTVKRYLKIDASWQEIVKGKLISRREILNGFEAIVFQHELDHLDGILFIDHVKNDRGKFFKYINKKMVDWDVNKISF